jgi:hypothetical protein
VLTAEDRAKIQSKARAAIDKVTLRKDPWWAYPLSILAFLGIALIYSTWAGLQTSGYFHEPYISPLFSPCLAANCEHVTFRLLGPFWTLTPFLLVGWLPILFRMTCYYYRKAYYRAALLSPPACAVNEPMPRYKGETKLLLFQNLHRYFFYLMIVNMGFLAWDTFKAFQFEDGFHVHVGSLVFLVMIITMSLYMLSCHSCRHAIGGHTNLFSKAPLRYKSWKFVTKLNKNHGPFAIASLFWIPITDLYVRLLNWGVIGDVRLF